MKRDIVTVTIIGIILLLALTAITGIYNSVNKDEISAYRIESEADAYRMGYKLGYVEGWEDGVNENNKIGE